MREWAWQDEILAVVPSGIDRAQLEASLKLTPTERLEHMRNVLVQLDEAKTASSVSRTSAPGRADLTDLAHIAEIRKQR